LQASFILDVIVFEIKDFQLFEFRENLCKVATALVSNHVVIEREDPDGFILLYDLLEDQIQTLIINILPIQVDHFSADIDLEDEELSSLLEELILKLLFGVLASRGEDVLEVPLAHGGEFLVAFDEFAVFGEFIELLSELLGAHALGVAEDRPRGLAAPHRLLGDRFLLHQLVHILLVLLYVFQVLLDGEVLLDELLEDCLWDLGGLSLSRHLVHHVLFGVDDLGEADVLEVLRVLFPQHVLGEVQRGEAALVVGVIVEVLEVLNEVADLDPDAGVPPEGLLEDFVEERVYELLQDLELVVHGAKGEVPCENFMQEDSQRPYVGCLAELVLWCQVEFVHTGELLLLEVLVGPVPVDLKQVLRSQKHLVLVHEDVMQVENPIHEVFLMQILHPLADLDEETDRFPQVLDWESLLQGSVAGLHEQVDGLVVI